MGLDDGFAPADCRDRDAANEMDARRIARVSSPPDKSETLARIIETEIIPRLLLANGEQPGAGRAIIEVDDRDIDDFADMMIGLEMTRAHAVVASALAKGVALDSIMLEVLAPTAHRLGQRWVDDDCTFADVTVGLCGLQSLLRAYGGGSAEETPEPGAGGALFASAPGEQHTFGVLMLETFFRRAGWDAVCMPIVEADEILAAVGKRSFDLVGLSLSRESELPMLATLVRSIRQASNNPAVTVMVGGRVFNDEPARVRAVGADLSATDARDAVVASQHLLWSTSRTH